MTDQQRSLRRPLLGAALTAAALGLCGVSPGLLAAGKRRVSVREEEIEPGRYQNHPKTQAFIDEMVARNGFQRAELESYFSQAVYSATVSRLIMPPTTPGKKSWRAYRSRFIEPIRINAGVRFWQQNRETLRRAETEFGVPASVIVGIIGVETIYGRDMGTFRVLDSLSTLAFDYPDTPNRDARTTLFRNQLADYLIWCRDTRTDVYSVLGSYAGAVGIPQFMPTSLREYAIDYDRDGHVDLRNSPTDAIGSVGRFLQLHGWEQGRPVAWRIAGDAGSLGVASAAADGEPWPTRTLNQLTKAGLRVDEPIDVQREGETGVLIVDLPTPDQPTEYMIGLRNFYVLTRYNRSFFYALAVYQLGEAVKAAMG
ncbi:MULTISPECIES: lytic murein transglycosylase B [unclassified Cupriavidus]|jgi:membrane-bound lytic murein transglycosylase B|uniref:lytic murein transglycosylase B n=1 Tax=unclassified Cupriavidus TaxID=2640874 RepID=UPI001BFFE5A1|nr:MULTISPECIES: lytic murein transglycosylase B [unclassified Cupriavidus]MCA3193043.1 lytic murein transglycosylase B [Cupriavidus sp.]MCA3195895.1 lytic murein transglycosylase B [Cupriavidus sp.]MCA3204796.1 lytic murein transglycosylase B [Cupriavidus sp.]MCA3206949.1 lytic murein transglycosylase B [Cupriavidus sp.]MCA3235335.1 lytic murein transglycosylase B [Cupriavidus sp.]